jgi:hypothetical protein
MNIAADVAGVHQESVGGGSAYLRELRQRNEDHQLYLRACCHQENTVHLKLYSEPVQLRAPPALAGDYTESVEYVSYDDGWPGYEEAAVDVNSQ